MQIMFKEVIYYCVVECEFEKILEIVECVNIVGCYVLMVKIYVIDNWYLWDVIYEQILVIEGVEGINIIIVFEMVFFRGVFM